MTARHMKCTSADEPDGDRPDNCLGLIALQRVEFVLGPGFVPEQRGDEVVPGILDEDAEEASEAVVIGAASARVSPVRY